MSQLLHTQPSSPPSPPGGAGPAAASQWAGIDPSQLEPRGNRRAMFVGAFALYLLGAVVVVVWLVAPQSNSTAATAEGQAEELRGAPIDSGGSNSGGGGDADDEHVDEERNSQGNPYDPRVMIDAARSERIDGRWAPVGFDILTSFDVPDPWGPIGALSPPAGRPEIPGYIRELDNEAVAIVGYASTHHLASEGRAREFVLFRTREQCCYGVLPLPHEVIICHVVHEKGLDLQDGVPMRIKGVLEIAPEYEGDYLLGVYRLEARDAQLIDR